MSTQPMDKYVTDHDSAINNVQHVNDVKLPDASAKDINLLLAA